VFDIGHNLWNFRPQELLRLKGDDQWQPIIQVAHQVAHRFRAHGASSRKREIGQVAYADKAARPNKKQQGGAGEPQTTPLEPEKQGGIGGP